MQSSFFGQSSGSDAQVFVRALRQQCPVCLMELAGLMMSDSVAAGTICIQIGRVQLCGQFERLKVQHEVEGEAFQAKGH